MLEGYPGPTFQETPKASLLACSYQGDDDQDKLDLTRVLIPAKMRMQMCILIGMQVAFTHRLSIDFMECIPKYQMDQIGMYIPIIFNYLTGISISGYTQVHSLECISKYQMDQIYLGLPNKTGREKPL